jgi:hypothetical protein
MLAAVELVLFMIKVLRLVAQEVVAAVEQEQTTVM